MSALILSQKLQKLTVYQTKKIIINLILFTIVAVSTELVFGSKTRSVLSSPQSIATKQNSRSTLVKYEIKPQATDPAIDDWLEPHYIALDKSKSPQNKLFLFFSGSYGRPSRQRLITEEAAKLGYHAINLRYPNTWTVGGLCRNSNDRDCHEKIRLEIIDGQNRTDEIDVNATNSIENRLRKLLIYLNENYPKQGWLSYLDGNSLKWESIVVAGHSQGGGHAAIIGKQHQVARVVMLGAPADYSRSFNEPAPWLAKKGVTSPDRYYGFVHTRDRGKRRIEAAWQLLGISAYGEIINVDRRSAPYNYSHQLITNATPARSGKYHGSVATDSTTPKSRNGTPTFEPVWKYLISVPENCNKSN